MYLTLKRGPYIEKIHPFYNPEADALKKKNSYTLETNKKTIPNQLFACLFMSFPLAKDAKTAGEEAEG